ncbi:MAG: hypothetical protein LQ341_007621, partial [Variospora aurantia]
NIKEGIQGHGVNWYSDVFDLVFPDLDPVAANDMWKEQLAAAEKSGAKAAKDEERDTDDD